MEIKWYFTFLAIAAIAAAVFGCFAYPAYVHKETDQMKACVNAGKTWVSVNQGNNNWTHDCR